MTTTTKTETVKIPGVRNVDPEFPTPFANGAWDAWVVGEAPAPTAAELAEVERHKAEARSHFAKREESFQRCDTDGFLTQWADGLHAQLEREKATIASNGGHALFPGLYEQATGLRVPAKLIEGEWGLCWALCDEAGQFTGVFINDARTKRAKLYKSGYVVLGEWAPAVAKFRGEGTGLSGSCWVATVRTDGGYPGCPR